MQIEPIMRPSQLMVATVVLRVVVVVVGLVVVVVVGLVVVVVVGLVVVVVDRLTVDLVAVAEEVPVGAGLDARVAATGAT